MEPSEPAPADPVSDFTPDIDPIAIEPIEPARMVELPVETPTAHTARFVFHGDAREYFRIWIVNALLSVGTLGIFSAWASVRTRRYLRGNTELLGHRFDYTADPRGILTGRALVAAFFFAFMLLGFVEPTARIAVAVLGVALVPWIVVRSLAFNARHTMWRGLRFRFHPSLSAAMIVYFFQALLVPLTLGLYYPAWARARAKFRLERHRFGTAYFRFSAPVGAFYRTYLLAGAIVLVVMILIGIVLDFLRRQNGGDLTLAQVLPVVPVYLAVFRVTKEFLFARLFNPIWNGTSVGEHRFHATLSTRRWLAIQLTNALAIIGSCGLLYPWAVIRSTRYRLSCLCVEVHGSVDWIARIGHNRGRRGNERDAEFTGIDFGL